MYDAVCGQTVGHLSKVEHLCVRRVPGSAKPEEQLEMHGLEAKAIEKAVRKLNE